MTPIETKDPVSKEPWTTKDAPTFTSEPDLEVTLKEDHNRFDDSRNIQSLRIREGPPNTSGNVSVAADPRRERTNRQAAESAKEYPPLMSTNKMKDSVPDKVITIKEVGIVQLEGPAVKLTSEREPNRQDGFKRNPPSNICKQIPAQDVGYLSIAKHQRGEKMVPSREKEFSKKCPQSKPTIVEEESVSKEAWDMTPVKAFLEDTSNDYPLSKPTVEKNDYVPNEVSDIKHGKWFQENCPKEYVQLKLPIEERDSFPREAPPVDQAKLHCADEPTSVKNSSRITRCVRQNAAVSAKATSVEDQKCPDDHEKNQRAAAFKRPQTKNIEYLSMATDKSRENFAEDQEEAEPITNISEGKQEWCDSRHTQRQGIGNLFLAEDQRCDSSIQDEEEDFPEEYVQLKPLDKEKTPFPRDAPAKKEVKTFGTEPDENLSSEEDQGWLDDCEEEHPKNVFKEPPPKDTVHLSMPKDEGGVNVIGVRCSQGKGFPAEYPELKVSIEKQDFVPTEDSILNQEKSFLAGPKPEQLRWEEEQTGWRGRDKKQRKQAIFERLQLKRNTRVSIDPPKSVRNTRAAEDRGATTVQPRPQEDQTGWHAIDKKPQKPVFVRVQRRWRARTSMEPEKSGEDTGAAQEKATHIYLSGATTVQPRPQEDWTGWHAIDKKPQKPIAERFQPRWNARVSLNPEESGENMGVAEEKGSTTVQPRPEENQMRWGGSEKMQWKPILERFQLKWSARVSVGPEKSRRHRGAGKDKVEPTVRVSSEQHSRCHSSVKKPQLHILERLQRKWSVRVCMETNQRKGKTKAAQMTYSSDEYPELKTATEKQDSVPVEDPEMNHEMSSTPETDLQVKSKEKKQTQAYENIQSVDIGQVSMTVGQRSKNTVSGEEEAESDLNMTSGDELNRCYSSESNQSLVEEKMQKPESNGTDRDEYPSAAAASAAGVAGAAAGASVGAAAAGGSAVVIGGGAASGASGGAPPGVVGGAGGVAPAAGGSGTDGGVVGAGGNFVTAGAAAAAAPDAAPTAASAAAAATSTAAASAVASAMEELVLQRRSGEINNQRFLTKENARHDRPRKKTSKEKHKVTKQVRAVVDVTQLSESVSEDDSGRPFKKQGSLNSDHASIDLKKVNELPGKRNKKIETEKNDLKKEISETREEKSKLEDEVVQGDEEFWKLRFTLRKELEETKNIHCIYEIMKKHLNEKEDQHKERAAVAQLATHLRTRDRELRITRDTLKELQEAQDQHIDAIKLAQKMKDDLQRVEHENSELKVKVKEQAKKIEKLSRRLQNSRERLGQSSKLTQSGVRETLEVLCKNNVSPMNQIGVRIHSLRSEPSQRKTVQDPNTSSLKSYEQQCIEELRISNALLYGLYNLHRNKRLEESRTKVHITVEQDTSPLSTSETRFDLKSPCVACACPHPYVFPREAGVIPGNPRSSNYSSQRCHRTTEDEEKSFKELTELKQTLEYKLYHQKKKNDEIEKEIIGDISWDHSICTKHPANFSYHSLGDVASAEATAPGPGATSEDDKALPLIISLIKK
ncbi:uncharacterized protein LOC110300178 [Mus caroli]|uniref:Uncharacterized protein LOC110300178 n=1 Tax=Mus caroli TaxID=10089 RepID=A0A6P5Q7Z2_MUSCR|nr:uncharacterized protein LOC110300178 [Mus caroli]